ncbi:MAG: LON peptidase substrate-binding domain-containing protein [Anaerolineales bacterium]
MFELPLFPLNTVLFPGMPIALHIFEERYKEMIGACLRHQTPFGVVLIRRGAEAHGPIAETYPVGCRVHIAESERLGQGRFNINAIGKDRFRIVGLKHNHPYLVGMVEAMPLAHAAASRVRAGGRALRPWIDRYLDILSSAGKLEIDHQHLPRDPIALAYLGAIVLQMPPQLKQPLLEIDSAPVLVDELRHVYRREVALLRAMLHTPQEEGPFTTN